MVPLTHRPTSLVIPPLAVLLALVAPAQAAGQIHLHGGPVSAFSHLHPPGVPPAVQPVTINRPFGFVPPGFQFRPSPQMRPGVILPHHMTPQPPFRSRRFFEVAALERALALSSLYSPNYAMPFAAGYGYPGTSYNPYAGYGAMAAPAYGNPYAYGMATPYANPYAASGSGKTVPGSGAGQQQQQQQSQDKSATSLLDALGVPNDGSRLTWPLGLRILPPAPETQTLRRQIDGLVRLLAQQAASGQVSSSTIQEASRAVDQLHARLRDRKDSLPTSANTFHEADHFLTQLEHGLKALR